MNDDLARQVAASLDAPPELLPLLPELLADLRSLSGPVETLLDVIRGLGLPADSRALDLGCGKGALARTQRYIKATHSCFHLTSGRRGGQWPRHAITTYF